ncbi:hypothetical protein [Phenylobacterium sp.]|uniref:hypothetical protein n=1 Tax=Phenylobacterium sp. TaxID=1871053 RepID=UPI00273211AF|nr:hypothetical protein [Phenylobacterium sp.]MDP1598437.1 hypothetical protein [Phenylobacterium sp.]MDP3591378.1 hypothetical protein [Phenylobacterium sp.]
MIEIVAADVVTGVARTSLGLPSTPAALDESYIASALRRLAGFLCPGSPRTLLRAMVDSHRGLVDDVDAFAERVEEVIETLVAIGDLLELGDVALEGEKVRSTWLVAAPPAFVVRESGNAFLLGLSADEQTPLPTEMRSRVAVDRGIRSIERHEGEDLGAVLRELGLRELSCAGWLRTPRPVDAAKLLAGYGMKLAACSRSGELPDLLVLDGSRNTRSYRRRWTSPGSLTGCFVVRRPQMFGSDLWGYAELRDGVAQKLLDLPLHGERWRGCDAAWRIQMAIDALAGRPQEYRLGDAYGGSRFDFFSPIPSWARRHLAVIGREAEPAGCLMSFLVPTSEVAAQGKLLNEQLYLSQVVE